jgi:hypothetical protein
MNMKKKKKGRKRQDGEGDDERKEKIERIRNKEERMEEDGRRWKKKEDE